MENLFYLGQQILDQSNQHCWRLPEFAAQKQRPDRGFWATVYMCQNLLSGFHLQCVIDNPPPDNFCATLSEGERQSCVQRNKDKMKAPNVPPMPSGGGGGGGGAWSRIFCSDSINRPFQFVSLMLGSPCVLQQQLSTRSMDLVLE